MPKPPPSLLSLFTREAERPARAPDPAPAAAPLTGKAPRPRDALTVSELVFKVKRSLEQGFTDVLVTGEVSQLNVHRNGHWYFKLKDQDAALPCVMFSRTNGSVRFKLQDGMQVLARGRVSTWEKKPEIQLLVDSLEPLGAGALALAFEQLKARLAQEGLFDARRKQPLPFLPARVGIVTSPQAAALRDVLKVLDARMPGLHIVVAPTRVQGDGAAAEIAQALLRLDASGTVDVIVLCRGGGSVEDLWAFNEEAVARAIARCTTPIVAGVGHETDTTIADLVADVRAATPSHAAERVVPKRQDLVEKLFSLERRIAQRARSRLDAARLRLEQAGKRIEDPRLLMYPARRRLDDLTSRLDDAVDARFVDARAHIDALDDRVAQRAPVKVLAELRARLATAERLLLDENPAPRVAEARLRLVHLTATMVTAHDRRCDAARARLEKAIARLDAALGARRVDAQQGLALAASKLHALSPLAVLGRGYAIALVDKRPLTRAADARVGAAMQVQLHGGRVDATIDGVTIDGGDET